ncbi:hypothetical protein CTA1_3108 [Colletotrichum tanaceti]|uniref:Uncharacterized protein n=1 Tax=Colletotrichum tanaceti TaxID=1306861 RepID=A0A4U6XB26_9PEZI|nr:hypothetical protein CTA1_3108 [Colletotrichum tanaceti]
MPRAKVRLSTGVGKTTMGSGTVSQLWTVHGLGVEPPELVQGGDGDLLLELLPALRVGEGRDPVVAVEVLSEDGEDVAGEDAAGAGEGVVVGDLAGGRAAEDLGDAGVVGGLVLLRVAGAAVGCDGVGGGGLDISIDAGSPGSAAGPVGEDDEQAVGVAEQGLGPAAAAGAQAAHEGHDLGRGGLGLDVVAEAAGDVAEGRLEDLGGAEEGPGAEGEVLDVELARVEDALEAAGDVDGVEDGDGPVGAAGEADEAGPPGGEDVTLADEGGLLGAEALLVHGVQVGHGAGAQGGDEVGGQAEDLGLDLGPPHNVPEEAQAEAEAAEALELAGVEQEGLLLRVGLDADVVEDVLAGAVECGNLGLAAGEDLGPGLDEGLHAGGAEEDVGEEQADQGGVVEGDDVQRDARLVGAEEVLEGQGRVLAGAEVVEVDDAGLDGRLGRGGGEVLGRVVLLDAEVVDVVGEADGGAGGGELLGDVELEFVVVLRGGGNQSLESETWSLSASRTSSKRRVQLRSISRKGFVSSKK